MITSLSDAVAPTTSSGVAFCPSGMTCGLGLSIEGIFLYIAVLFGGLETVLVLVTKSGLEEDETNFREENEMKIKKKV